MWAWVLPILVWNMVIFSQIDLVLSEFLYNTVSAREHENLHFDSFSFGVG